MTTAIDVYPPDYNNVTTPETESAEVPATESKVLMPDVNTTEISKNDTTNHMTTTAGWSVQVTDTAVIDVTGDDDDDDDCNIMASEDRVEDTTGNKTTAENNITTTTATVFTVMTTALKNNETKGGGRVEPEVAPPPPGEVRESDGAIAGIVIGVLLFFALSAGWYSEHFL